MNAVISFMSTDQDTLNKFWKVNGSALGTRLGSNLQKPDNIGGLIQKINLDDGKVILEKPLNKPQALYKFINLLQV